MPAVFVETLKNRPFSSWPLLPNNSIPEQLAGNVTIVGYNEQESRLAISHKDITTQAFMEAHIRGSSKQGDNTIPPFYFPAPHVCGPDVIFFVQINGEYFPVFTQLFELFIGLKAQAMVYLEFPGWTSQASVQSFINRVKDQLPDDESKNAVDALLPEEAIERIIRIGDPKDWKSAIDNTETMLISCKEQERRGNLIGELIRVESKIAKHPQQFASLSSIKETLGLFIYRWFILGETAIVLEDEAQLVEAAFGRIKMLGGNARTVLDEPFVLLAAKNYFNQKDPLFIAAAKRAMLSSSDAS
ncbi:hypothetical protein BGX26_006469, partial [Mortierella sp. AD094]